MRDQIRPLPFLTRDLQTLTARRGLPYAQQSALLVRWETDKTNAQNDVAAMHNLLNTSFGINCTNFIIQRASHPAWVIARKILEVLKTYHSPQQPGLFIFYYAGHSGVPVDDASEQFSLESEGKYILWSTINEILLSSEGNENLDVLVILDCPFGGEHREYFLPRTVEILAAGRGTLVSRNTTPISFTQQICHAVHSLKVDGQSITINDLFTTLQARDSTSRPFHATLSGDHPIVLKFQKSSNPSARGSIWPTIGVLPTPSTQNVIVKLAVPNTTDGRLSFYQAIQELPANMEVDVLLAYEAD
ncbi:hypothetical protein N7493_009195 [Penicillium malachiteum]|uniref:Uncharacterized protein n=1 Tax=Penicillium malachiteum TaxID=1324776 RepID=A0AAD6MTC7_9EURO|nr:hypothetical protein N7493_009195 [Penicillium malachiteum]